VASSKLKVWFTTGLAVALALVWALERRVMLRLREENQALHQQAEEAANISAENQRLARRLADLQASTTSVTIPRLPAPQATPNYQASEAEAEPVASTNLFALIFHGGNPPELTPDQVQTYLKENNRSAASLLTAFRATKDTNLLAEALEKYPHDPQVNYASLFDASSPEERRQRMEAFKQSAPDNALGNYLSAFDYIKAGQNDLAIQELTAASSKEKFSDYSLEFVQSAEEAWRAAGYTVADSKTIAAMELLLPDLKELRDLSRNTVALASSYQQAADGASAQALLRMNINLGIRFNGAPGEALISQLVGIAIEADSLRAMSPTAEYASGQTVQQRLDQLTQQRNELKDLANNESLLENMPAKDVISYWDRWRGFGSESTLRWAAGKYGAK
jgi:hypothetical protein